MADHPIREFIEHGIRVTVNRDDLPPMFSTDMNNEYIQLHEQRGFTVPELFQLKSQRRRFVIHTGERESDSEGTIRLRVCSSNRVNLTRLHALDPLII